MPSEQRLHPATLLFDLGRHLKAFALPAILVIFGMSRSSGGPGGMFGGMPDRWEVWLLLLFVPATLVSILRYVTFRLYYAERELVIRSGFIFRNERHIPFSRIQNVDAIQNFFHRLLGVVEVRVETGGGQEEEARLSVLPLSALEEIRNRVFGASTGHMAPEHPALEHPAPEHPAPEHPAPEHPAPWHPAPGHPAPEHRTHPTHRTHRTHPVLLHLPPKELLLFGFLENKGMVLVAATLGVLWQADVMDFFLGRVFGDVPGRVLARRAARTVFEDGYAASFLQIVIALIGFVVFLAIIRGISMLWALIRLYDFRLTRIGEDLRTEYGLITRVAATVPIRRVQTITIRTGLLHRWLDRASVRVTTAGGAGKGTKRNDNVREWLAPLIKNDALPSLLQQVLPGFNIADVTWQPIHPRAFRRAVKPPLIFSVVVSLSSALVISWGAIGVAILMLLWSFIATRQYVAHLGWAEGDEVVMMKSGWLWRQVTLARVNKIQAVALHESPFDRRAAMARVRVDTAGAGAVSHRVDIPYLDHQVAFALAQRLSASAANTAFRW